MQSFAFAAALAAAVAVASSKASFVGNHMNQNVPYTIANANDPKKNYSFRGDGYFEVATVAMNTTYSEVFWTSLPPVDLPTEIVEKFKDKNIVVTGFEVDVRRKTSNGEESVPVYQSYNHHYGPAIHSSYATYEGAVGPSYGHGPTTIFAVKEGSNPPAGAKLAENFVHGNGNEHRQVFHGAPTGYGQFVYSPLSFTIVPMQINTNDGTGRKGAGGPIPKFSQKHTNPNGFYSPLLECPCTSRIVKDLGKLTAQISGKCEKIPIASSDCFAGAQIDFGDLIQKNVTVDSTSVAPGCTIARSSPGAGTFVVTFNTMRQSSVKCEGSTKASKSSGSAASLVSLNVSINAQKDEVLIAMEGPSDVWFGIGFNASLMQDLPYTIVVLGNGSVTERKLGYHMPGSLLSASLKVLSTNVVSGRRSVVLSRALAGITPNHYSFSPDVGTLPFINAIGSTKDFGQHKDRAPASLLMLNGNNPTCLCSGQEGTIDGFPLNANCLPEPISDLLKTENPTCQVSTYVGGLACCRHGAYLLDADQEIPPHVDSVFFRFRFYYQESTVNVKPIYHVEWAGNGCDSGASGPNAHHCTHIEFDITTGAPTQTFQSEFEAGMMMEDSCSPTSPQCMSKALLGPSGKIELVMAAAHCHAPNCISQELIRMDTGEVLCRAVPVHGESENIFDEKGYLSTPPCAWSHDAEDGLPTPPQLAIDTPMKMQTTFNSTYFHAGQMSIWQMKAAFV